LPSIRSLFQSFNAVDPPAYRQRAITPKLLRKIYAFADTPEHRHSAYAHAADLIIGAFFFAMRSCEYTLTATPGRTKMITLSGVLFRSQSNATIDHSDPRLSTRAEFVTITFVDQKNGTKMDSRTQRRTGDPVLCPILRWAAVVTRVLRNVPSASCSTPVCSTQPLNTPLLIHNDFVRQFIRFICSYFGGEATFGFGSADVGNKSIRSGAAMALFLMNHSVAKIMILGRWSSDAFLAYIRPQVLEWTNNMSKDMIKHDTFFDATHDDSIAGDDPCLPQRLLQSFNGRDSVVVIPRFHLHH
jgi:hypothetical protein